jgi:hypothetical protein
MNKNWGCFNKAGKLLVVGAIVAAFLSGCGGGSGSGSTSTTGATIRGTAAAGAPVIGYVSVQDSSSNLQPVLTNIAIEADGKYSVDVTGLTPPFAFKAVGNIGGRQVTLYSPATSADVGGTINITPFTDLIVRNLAGSLASSLIDSYLSSGSLSSLTAVEINAERDKLQTQLLPVLQAAGLTTGIDLLRASFNADGTGLDRFMDLVKVDTTVPTAVTITNILDANASNVLTIDAQTGVTTGNATLASTGITDGTTATPIDLIRQTFTSLNSYFATSLPNPANSGLTALFAPSFMINGNTSGDFLTYATTTQNLIGMTFGANLTLDSIDTANGIAQISFKYPDGSLAHWQMKKVGAAWLLDGNQRLANIQVTTSAMNTVCSAGNQGCVAGKSTGLKLWFENDTQQAIGSVVVTGPGLPNAGVTITGDQMVVMTDVEIGVLGANNTYTMAVWSNAVTPTLLGTYTDTLPAPVLNTTLPTLSFPSLGGVINLTGYAGGTLTPTWTIPAGLTGDNVGVYMYTSSTYQTVTNDFNGKSGSGKANLVVTGVWDHGNYWIRGLDTYGGEVITHYE